MSSFFDFNDVDFKDVIEPKPAEEGEYTIRIIDWKTDKKDSKTLMDKNDEPFLMPSFEIIDCEEALYAKNFNAYIKLPHKEMDKKEKNEVKWNLKAFFTCFGVDINGGRVNYDDMIGLSGDVLLIVTPDEGYGEQNKIKRFMTPR